MVTFFPSSSGICKSVRQGLLKLQKFTELVLAEFPFRSDAAKGMHELETLLANTAIMLLLYHIRVDKFSTLM